MDMSDFDDPDDEIAPNSSYLVFDFDWATEEWVLAGDALRETIEFYLAAGDGDRAKAESAALCALKRRLENLSMHARAYKWEYAVWHEMTTNDPDTLELFEPKISNQDNSDIVHHGFWWALEQAEINRLSEVNPNWPCEHTEFQDWVAGDFEFRSYVPVQSSAIKSTTVEGFARGVCFNRSGLPATNRVQNIVRAEVMKLDKPDRHPRLPDAVLLDWWNTLSPETRQMPIDEVLTPMARSAFPKHSIARERVRALEPGRKPGPKPIR